MNSTSQELKQLLDDFLIEDGKFNSGNKSAGTRARKKLQEIIKLSKLRRIEIQDSKKAE